MLKALNGFIDAARNSFFAKDPTGVARENPLSGLGY
jgi:hypothetical protein